MKLLQRARKFLNNTRGTVAVLFALSVLPMMMVVGSAIDYSKASNLHTNVSASVDAALVATATNILNDVSINLENQSVVVARAEELFETFLFKNIKSNLPPFYNGANFSFDTGLQELTVSVDASYKTHMAKIAGFNTVNISTSSAVKLKRETGGSLSMYLVLDRSGSMGWNFPTRMTSLKVAVDGMIDGMKEVDPDKQFIRMGAVAYNHYTFDQKSIRWNLSAVNNYVQAMNAGGGTNSSGAVKKAYKQLKKQKEIDEHYAKSEQVPKLVMVFMTDGNNNASSYDNETLKYCTKAKNYGMEIYTVAFQAPSKGQALLEECATTSSHYFEVEDNDKLIEIFKKIGSNVTANLFISK